MVPGFCISVLVIGLIIILPSILKVVMEYEKGIHFRLGKVIAVREPGLVVLIPFIDSLKIVDLRIHFLDIPKQETLTKDNISTVFNAVVYYRITDPLVAVVNIQDIRTAIYEHGQAAMRDITGLYELDTILAERERIANEIRNVVAKDTASWGVEIISINIQDIEIPENMKKAISRQAQAERDKRATVLVSLGEVEASKTIVEASRILTSTPGALHLRTLQALTNLSADKTNTITYLLPLTGQSLFVKNKESKPESDTFIRRR